MVFLGQKHSFTFDKVFAPDAYQVEAFTEISQLVQSALDGYKVIPNFIFYPLYIISNSNYIICIVASYCSIANLLVSHTVKKKNTGILKGFRFIICMSINLYAYMFSTKDCMQI